MYCLDLFDTSQYCTLEGGMLMPTITPESSSDCDDFYQSCQQSSFPQSSESMQNQSQNLFGHELIGFDAMPATNYGSVPDFAYAQANLPAQMLTAQRCENNNVYAQMKAINSNFGTNSLNHYQMTQPEIDPGTGLPRRICSNCGSISTPSWRRCPEGRNLLCNACGLYQKLHKRPRPLMIREDGSVQVIRSVNSSNVNVCQNCKTTETPIWRRSPDGRNQMLCNACALYFKNHNSSRPPNLKFSDDYRNLLS